MRQRTDTEVGRFEIIYGGGAGAMQAFERRIDEGNILKVMAFIDAFRENYVVTRSLARVAAL